MKGQSSDTCVVGTHNLDTVAASDGPHTDGAVWRCREGHSLQGETKKESGDVNSAQRPGVQTLWDARNPECYLGGMVNDRGDLLGVTLECCHDLLLILVKHHNVLISST